MRIAVGCALSASMGLSCGCAATRDHAKSNPPSASHAMSAAQQPAPVQPEATSLLGKALFAPALPPETLARREAELRAAQAAYDRDPHNADAIIWFGRRTAYLGRHRDAIDIFSNGLALHPENYRLLRHRGHRYITVRRLDDAIGDLSRAAQLIEGVPDEIEPDGQPNRLNIPTSTSHTNIYYHLGLAHYLQGEFADAERAYRRCLEFSKNDDMHVATAYWLYLTLRRQGKHDEAAAFLSSMKPDMNIIENEGYHRLLRFFEGELSEQEAATATGEDRSVDLATVGYGIGAWHLLNGDTKQAAARFEDVIANTNWAAFGHIAAEADLARQQR